MPSIIVMGVSGCGKSTLGQALAQALHWPFIEGDTLHPAANIAKMTAGIALEDADRLPWLENVANAIATHTAGSVIACSALKRSYRDLLRRADPRLFFVYPVVSPEQLHARLQRRRGHFMPASLLASQLSALERPQDDERFTATNGEQPIHEQIAQVLAALGR